jgi:hypothetical protein
VPNGSDVLDVHVAEPLETLWALQPVRLAYVLPFVDASKFTVPVAAPGVMVAVNETGVL